MMHPASWGCRSEKTNYYKFPSSIKGIWAFERTQYAFSPAQVMAGKKPGKQCFWATVAALMTLGICKSLELGRSTLFSRPPPHVTPMTEPRVIGTDVVGRSRPCDTPYSWDVAGKMTMRTGPRTSRRNAAGSNATVTAEPTDFINGYETRLVRACVTLSQSIHLKYIFTLSTTICSHSNRKT